MAENVDLGTFTFDTDKVVQNIEKLQKELFALRAEQKEYAKNSRELDKATQDLVKQQNDLIKAGKEGSKQYKENEKTLNALVKTNFENFKSQEQVKDSIKKTSAEYKQATKSIDSLKDAEGQLVSQTEAINQALDREVKSIADARESNKELLALRNQLNIAGGENEEELKNLNAALDKNNAFIKENVSAYEQQKIGIGDYQTAIENALGGTKLFGVSLQEVKGVAGQFSGVFNLIKKDVSQVTESMRTNTKATEGMSGAQKMAFITTNGLIGGLKLLRIALVATGIGAIVVVLGSLITYLSTTQAGIDAVTKVTRPLSAVFQTLIGVFQKIGEYTFNNPLEGITKLYDFVKNQVIRTFEVFWKILSGIATLDWDKAGEGLQDLKNQADENAESIKNFGKEVGDMFDEAYKKGKRIDELQKQQEQKEIDIIAYRAEQEIQLKRLENIQKNQLLSAEERNKAIEEGEQIAKELVSRENEILDLNIEQLKIKHSLNDTSREEEKQLQELIAQRIANESKVLDVEKRALGDRKQLYNEAANAAKEQIQKVQDAAIKANQEQLDLFLAQQGFKKKSAEEELEIAKEKRDREIEILNQELEYKKVTQVEYQTRLLELNNEYLETQRDLVIANAEAERDALLESLGKRINDYAEYTEEHLQADRDRIAEQLEINQTYAEQQLEQGVINQEEYDDKIKELKDKAREEELASQIGFEEANRERALIDLENQRAIDEENFLNDYEIKAARLEQQRLLEVEAAEKTGSDIALINEKYELRQRELTEATAEFEKKIEEQKQQAKLSQAKAVFNGLSELLGKESAAGKAAAIAASVINTFQGVTKALAEGGVLGIATGALVAATGAVSIGKIMSTKPPTRAKAERGMRVPKKGTMLRGRSHAQGGIPIEAEGGEAIINKRSTSMFSGLLSAINVAGGGIPLAARGAIVGGASSRNANVQSRLMQDSNALSMNEMIAEAVRQGSMEGSAIGSRNGSQDGIIGLSENRQVQQNSSF